MYGFPISRHIFAAIHVGYCQRPAIITMSELSKCFRKYLPSDGAHLHFAYLHGNNLTSTPSTQGTGALRPQSVATIDMFSPMVT